MRIQSHQDQKFLSIRYDLNQSRAAPVMPTLCYGWSAKAVVSIKPNKHLYRGENVTLRCDIQEGGDTEWTYSWSKDNKRLYTEGEDRVYTDSTMQEISIRSVNDSDSGVYTCRRQRRDSQSSEISDAVTLTVSERPKPVLSVSPQSWLTEGDSVTLNCEITNSSTNWTFSWYRDVPYRDGLLQLKNYHSYVELLSDSSRGSGGIYTLSPAALNHTGVYRCRGEREQLFTKFSKPQPVWITGESPPVSLIINPNRTQHFTGDSLSLSCEDQRHSTGWTVRRYTHSEGVLDCSWWGSVTGSTCKISSLYTGVYWCESESGENSNPVNITMYKAHLLFLFLFSADFTYTIDTCSRSYFILTAGCFIGRAKAVVTIEPDKHVYRGENVTLTCDIQGGGDTKWTYSWYKNNKTFLSGRKNKVFTNSTIKWPTIRFINDSDSGNYTCRGQRHDSQSSVISDAVTLTVSGESPPVSLIINPNRTQHFTGDSLSLSCEDQRHSTGWIVRRYTRSEGVLDCSWWGSVTGSTCEISSINTSYTGVYWCVSESGENSNPVNITLPDGSVILESPVHPVTEGHPLTLRCLGRNTNFSNLRADFYKDGSVLQTQTTGEMIIHKVSKSNEGFYHCKHSERGESLKSWVSVRKKQQKPNHTSDQKQSRSGAEDSQSGHTPLHAGQTLF
ncbi:leukocyte immunoglobulin-like receptor subfamily A member 2 [Clarias gariepinus]